MNFLNELKVFLNLWLEKKINSVKLYNLLKVKFAMMANSPRLMGYPYILIIEPTNLCNLKCPTCPTGNGTLARSKGMMSFETFQKVIDEMGKYLINIVMMNFGEPLLNKDFYRMVEYAHSKNINVMTCTNGHYINPGKLIDSKIDNITIALDGLDQKTLEKFRIGADYNVIMRGLDALVKEKKLRNSKIPKINLQFIMMKHNEHQMDEVRELANRLEVDSLTFKSLWVTTLEQARQLLPANSKFHRYLLKNDSYEVKDSNNFLCKKMWSELVVNYDGSVVLCCSDYNNSVTFGNVTKAAIKSILMDTKASQIRKILTKDRTKIPVCKNCAPNDNISITIPLK